MPSRKSNRYLILLLVPIILISLIYSLDVISRSKFIKEKKQAREFLEQVIESVNQKTDFYKNYTRYLDIEEHREKFSDNYKIELIDGEPGFYEYNITFDNKHSFYIVVGFYDDVDGFRSSHLKLIKK